VSPSVGGVVQHVRSRCPCSGVWVLRGLELFSAVSGNRQEDKVKLLRFYCCILNHGLMYAYRIIIIMHMMLFMFHVVTLLTRKH